MAQNLNENVENFNQEVLTRELSAALIIEHQLQAIMDDMIDKNPSEKVKKLQNKILIAAQESIKSMLQANSKEVFILQQQRFNQLISNFKEKLALDDDLESALEGYRFFNTLHRFLQEATSANIEELHEKLPSWFKDHANYMHWKIELDFLKGETNPQIFEAHKKALINDLLPKESYPDLANLASMALIEQNGRLLADTRLSYLKEMGNRKNLLVDTAWMGVGALLVAGAAVLSLAFPPLIIPGLVVGAAVLGYGVIDFMKKSADLYSEFQVKPLGERKVAPDTMEKVKELENTLYDPAKSNFIERQQLEKKHWSNEEKLIKGAGYGASFTGFALAIAALTLIIPGVGVPIAAVIAVTVLSLAAVAFAAGLLGARVVREQQHQQTVQSQVAEKISEDEKITTQLDELYKANTPAVVPQPKGTANKKTLSKTAPPKPTAAPGKEEDEGNSDKEEVEEGDEGDAIGEKESKSPGKR